MPETHDTAGRRAGLGRRELLLGGGAAISLGALLAACGGDEAAEPGRVGYAPPATALPSEEVDDAVLLRTAQSIEYTILEVYGMIAERGVLEGDAATLLEALVEEHEDAADEVGRIVRQAGGEPYECANTWYLERVIPPIFRNIDGDEAEGIAPTDDPVRDLLAVMNAMESLAASMYQNLVEELTEPRLRAAVVALATRSARHSAAVAITSSGAPEGYVSPTVHGEEATPDEDGLVPLYAIPSQFGLLSPYSLVIGALSEAGTRYTQSIDTPADNSYAYHTQSCSA
jgi:hypothetical protein